MLSPLEAPFVTGDIILFSGEHPLHRRVQEWMGSCWSQVGLIVACPITSEMAVLQSTKAPVAPDVVTGTLIQGVQVVSLTEQLRAFPGRAVVRRLSPFLSSAEREKLRLFMHEVHGRPYQDSAWYAGRARRRRNHPSTQEAFFCSELVAEAYQRVGVLSTPPAGRSQSNYIPADFGSEDECLDWANHYRLGSEIDIPSREKGTASDTTMCDRMR